ncbi:MAG TPA: Gfo/Idh/MocA family oxidoreductase, partial [Chloroflexota bacterium]|nr:Gfo/Idh/MocA family oxidoreductase [Chloroflexota bacterium]
MIDSPGRIGLVGVGDFGLFCLEGFAETSDIQVVAVADPRPDLAERTASLRTGSLYSDWHALLADPAVEVVHVATPPWTHAEITLAAAEAGKSVFVEKPLALTVADADAMMAAFRSHNLTLGIDYVMRHSPIYRLLIDIVGSELLGRVRRISVDNAAQSVPAGHWFWDPAKSGGILVEHGVHFFDVFQRIAGPARPLYCADGTNRILAALAYDGGAWGTYYHDFSLDHRVERFEAMVVFERGTARIAGWIPELLELQ